MAPEDRHIQVSWPIPGGGEYMTAGIISAGVLTTDMGDRWPADMVDRWVGIDGCQCAHCTRIVHQYL